MMKKLLKYVLVGLLLSATVACNPFDVEEVLLSRDDLSLTWKGDEQLSYDPLTWQWGFNDRKNEYRVHDDTMANYYILRCNARLAAEGQEVEADIEWTVRSNIKRYEGLRFVIMKVDDQGRIWLWNKSQKIGVIVMSI